MANNKIQFSLEELCQVTDLPTATVIEIVEQGIVEPTGRSPESWVFSTQMIVVTKKALRLHRDLGIDWSGIALALCLIDELAQLREKNQRLQRQLSKFVPD
jgi:chaperone modulatory protein CbpM